MLTAWSGKLSGPRVRILSSRGKHLILCPYRTILKANLNQADTDNEGALQDPIFDQRLRSFENFKVKRLRSTAVIC
jgi:hypothetical protein